ncbi:MAG: LPS assembly protein LptD [Desulfobulbaceae bacterium]|nr:LPS assembly protein LptD [Desulfobulbaceae bacterium]
MKQYRGVNPVLTLSAMITALFAGLFFLPADSLAEVVNAEQWDISADKMTRYENPPSIIAEGNVILQKTRKSEQQVQPQSRWDSLLEEAAEPDEGEEGDTVIRTETLTTIKADWVAYDINLGAVKARGNVFINVAGDELTASRGEVDLNDETGTFTDAVIVRHDNKVHLEGRVIEKTGDITYRIEDGWIITCKLEEGEVPPWSFAAKDADISEGGYAILKHTTFRIKNVPVLYTPWMVLPVKNTRQTGFLFPAASISDRDGFGINLPLFLNLSPSSDLTIYPEYLSNRGVNAGVEFRYIMDQESKGSFMANYLYDDLSDPSEVDYYRDGNYSHTNKDRYWLRGKADHDFAGWIARLDLDVVSDRDYLVEFTSGLTGFDHTHDQFFDMFGRGLETETVDERRNTLRLLKSWRNMSLNAELLGINDVRLDKSSPTPLWKLPSINHSGLIPIGDTLIDLSWFNEYVNYWREDGVGAHRVDIFPQLTAPIPLTEYLEATAGIGVRDTFYMIEDYGDSTWTGSDTENRLLYELDAQIGTTLMGDFDLNLKNVNAWRHIFRPYVAYNFIPDEDQSDLPQFDTVDLIEESNMVTYGIDNFFKIFGNRNSRPYEREYGYFKIFQGYDLRSEASDKPYTPINVKIGYNPLARLSMIYKTEIDVYGDGAISYGFEGAYSNNRGDTVFANYRYNKLENINSVSLNTKINLVYNFRAAYLIERSLEDSQTIQENIALVYNPACWSVELSSHRTHDEQKFMLIFRLANIGNPFGIDLPGF